MALNDNPGMGPYGSEQGIFDSAIANLRQKGAEFSQAYNVLMSDYSRASQNAATLEQWNTLKSYADKVRGTIEYITGAVDSVSGWFSNTFGLSAVSVVKQSGLGNLGIVPLIPIAAITAAVAAIVYIVGEIYKFHALLNATPQQVENVKQGEQATAGGVVASVSDSLKWVAIGALVIYGLPKILEMVRRK